MANLNWYQAASQAAATNEQIKDLLVSYNEAKDPADKETVKNLIIQAMGDAAPAENATGKKSPALFVKMIVSVYDGMQVLRTHNTEVVIPKPAVDWDISYIRSAIRRRILKQHLALEGVTFQAFHNVITDESQVREGEAVFNIDNKPRDQWNQMDYQLYFIKYGLRSAPLMNTTSILALGSWIDRHPDGDETTTLPSESDR